MKLRARKLVFLAYFVICLAACSGGGSNHEDPQQDSPVVDPPQGDDQPSDESILEDWQETVLSTPPEIFNESFYTPAATASENLSGVWIFLIDSDTTHDTTTSTRASSSHDRARFRSLAVISQTGNDLAVNTFERDESWHIIGEKIEVSTSPNVPDVQTLNVIDSKHISGTVTINQTNNSDSYSSSTIGTQVFSLIKIASLPDGYAAGKELRFGNLDYTIAPLAGSSSIETVDTKNFREVVSIGTSTTTTGSVSSSTSLKQHEIDFSRVGDSAEYHLLSSATIVITEETKNEIVTTSTIFSPTGSFGSHISLSSASFSTGVEDPVIFSLSGTSADTSVSLDSTISMYSPELVP